MASQNLIRFLQLAKKTGCPKDQIENFISAGYVPQPMQLRLHAAARLADKPDAPDEIGVGGARGPGKSHSIFSQISLDDCWRVPALKTLYLRKIGKQAKEQLEDLKHKVLRSVPHHYNRHEGIIKFHNDSRIMLGHFQNESDIDVYLGLEYDVIAIEEATTLSQSKYQALRDSNRTSKPGFRPRIYNSTNPGGIGHAWYKKRFIEPWRQDSEKFTKFIPGTLEDNKFIDADYRRKIEENTGWKLKAYRYGEWDIAAGQYFEDWGSIHILPKDFKIEPWWQKFGGYDHGYNHPYVFGAYAVDGDGNVIKYAECGERFKKPDEIFNEIMGVCPDGKTINIFSGHDCWSKQKDGGPAVVERFRALGLHMVRAKIDRTQGAQNMRYLLDWREDKDGNIIKKPKFYVKANCWRTIHQIPNMIYDEKNPEDMMKVDATEEDTWAGDDAVDETRYALMSRYNPSIMKLEKAKEGTGGWWMELYKRKENRKPFRNFP